MDPSVPGFEPLAKTVFDEDAMRQELVVPTDQRIFAIAQGLYAGTHSVEDINSLTEIDNWSLSGLGPWLPGCPAEGMQRVVARVHMPASLKR